MVEKSKIEKNKYIFVFQTSLTDKENFSDYIFTDPVDVIKVMRYEDASKAFELIERYAQKYYLAGYFSYELGYYFERQSFRLENTTTYPLIHLAVFDKAGVFHHKSGKGTGNIFPETKEYFQIDDLRFNLKEHEYAKKISRIKEHIKNGLTYQVNFTGKFNFNFSGSPFALYQDLISRQPVPYSAFCRLGEEYILSLSPELFFRREGARIYSRPMKGTIKRGKNIFEDKEKIEQLRISVKNRAENIMIVDMVRNDLGRIAKTDSVEVSKVFDIEKYNTLFQMTSTVKGVLKENSTYFDIFRNIFPGGSVTGAPKIKTMQIIRELEKGNRGVYCGALGIISPGKRATFNLPIRTVSISKGRGQMGVGSGIVIDSEARYEFEECLLKADFLTRRYKPFQLIETILWNGRYKFLSDHLKRLKDSAAYFGFIYNEAKIKAQLKKCERAFKKASLYRLRLLLDKRGLVELECLPIKQGNALNQQRIAISKYRLDPENIFLYHKTTNRDLYDRQHALYTAKGYFDVMFLNTRNEVAEGAISNIIVQKNVRLYTPPVASGLLPGVFRQHLLNIGKVKERVLTVGDLRKADKIFVCNSVRGLIEVKLKEG